MPHEKRLAFIMKSTANGRQDSSSYSTLTQQHHERCNTSLEHPRPQFHRAETPKTRKLSGRISIIAEGLRYFITRLRASDEERRWSGKSGRSLKNGRIRRASYPAGPSALVWATVSRSPRIPNDGTSRPDDRDNRAMNFTDIALSKTARERALLYAARPESVQRAVGRDTRENEGELIFPLCREGEEREREREREREKESARLLLTKPCNY